MPGENKSKTRTSQTTRTPRKLPDSTPWLLCCVYAWHGGNLMGLKSPVYRMNMRNHEKNYPKPTAEGRPTVGRQAGRKPSGDGQEPHIRPSGWNELAQHNEIPSFSPAGKWGTWVVEIPAPYPGRSVPLASGFRAGSASVSNGRGRRGRSQPRS